MSQTTAPTSTRETDARRQDQRSRRGLSSRLVGPVLMLGGIAIVVVAGVWWWLQGGRYVAIDNAYVGAAKLAVSTDISGMVAEVTVREGQRVAKGDVLFRLDARQFQIAAEGAEATLSQVPLNVEAMKRDYQRMLRDIGAKQVSVQASQVNFDRVSALARTGASPQRDFDDARFRLAGDHQALEALREQAQVQLAKLGGNAEIDARETPEYRQADARLRETRRQLEHAEVRAPFAGIVTQVGSLQPGMYLAASMAGVALVSTEQVWIDANPKETELTFVKPGDHATVTVDTYPGRQWKARVESIAPASAAQFSILPAQNASGNWVKVVQRIPLRITVERQAGDPDLRAGMSAVVEIDTGHTRMFSDLF